MQEEHKARLRRSREVAARASARAEESREADAVRREQLERMRAAERLTRRDGAPAEQLPMTVVEELPSGSRVRTSMPRGPLPGAEVVCGACGTRLAVGYRPEDVGWVLVCAQCRAYNSGGA